jgi:type I restriction enzyme S subunit
VSELPKGWAPALLDAIADVLDFEREPINSSERESRVNGKTEADLFPYYGATGQVGFIDSFRSEGQRVLLGEDAAPFLDPVKDKAYLANGRFWVNNHAHVLAGAAGLIDNRFLCHQLNTLDYHPFVTGSTRLKLTSSAMKQIPVVVAPAAEQTRIVAKLEELLSDLDAGVAELKAAQKKLAQYRQSLLKAAVEGALTAEWRAKNTSTETGAQLLERILKERRARWEAKQLAKFESQGKAPPKDWQKKYPEPVQPDTTDLPALPQGWVWCSLGQCFHVAVGATPSRKEPGYWNGAIPWVSSGEVRFSRITETKEQISGEGLLNSSTQINPVGSVLLGMIGEGKTRGQVAILDIAAANNQNCAAIWVSETEIPPEYVYFWLWSQYEQTRRGSSGNNQPALNKSIVERICLPVAPLDEMKEIVRLIDGELNRIFEQETAVELALKQSTAQRQNILRAAFSGQLVPQDPNDEPASALLDRIRAERAAREPQKKPRGRQAKEAV